MISPVSGEEYPQATIRLEASQLESNFVEKDSVDTRVEYEPATHPCSKIG